MGLFHQSPSLIQLGSTVYLTYKPSGQEPQQWVYEPGKLRVSEAEAIEDRTGMPYGGDFKLALLKGNVRARRALLWTFLRRQHPALSYADVDFADEEVQLELDRDEVKAELEAIADNPSLSEDDRRMAEMVFRAQLETAPEPPGKAEPQTSDIGTA